MKGTSLNQPRKVKIRRSHEINCVKCGITIDYYEFVGSPVKIVTCPNCKSMFNVETGKVLSRTDAV